MLSTKIPVPAQKVHLAYHRSQITWNSSPLNIRKAEVIHVISLFFHNGITSEAAEEMLAEVGTAPAYGGKHSKWNKKKLTEPRVTRRKDIGVEW